MYIYSLVLIIEKHIDHLKQKNPYTFFEQFCLRTPLLPLTFYHHLTQQKHITLDQYKEIWKDPMIKEAIFLASPELFSEIEKWLSGQLTDIKKNSR